MTDVSTRHRVCKLATCNLNQWAMDFAGNLQRVEQSIQQVYLPLETVAARARTSSKHGQCDLAGWVSVLCNKLARPDDAAHSTRPGMR